MSELLSNYGRSASDPPSTTSIWRGEVTKINGDEYEFVIPRLTGVNASYTATTSVPVAADLAVGDNIILSFSEGRNDEIAVLGKVNTVISSTEGVITGVTAGTNLNGGGSAGSVTLNLDSSITLTTVNADLVGSQSGGSVSATTLTASGDANFDSGTLFVDVSANRVGIGTTSPTYDLDIENATAAIVSLNDSGGTAGGSTNAHFIFESGGSDAGKLGFINSGDATMKLQNFDGVLTLETLTDDSVSAFGLTIRLGCF